MKKIALMPLRWKIVFKRINLESTQLTTPTIIALEDKRRCDSMSLVTFEIRKVKMSPEDSPRRVCT